MADALLSPAVGTTFWAGSLGAMAWCARKLREGLDDRMVPLMGVLGAFIFAAQMINFTIPGTGSSGHLAGGIILAAVLGPHASFIVMASVLTVQALFFADGGLLALGCNIWNLGVYPCFIAYPLIYRPLTRTGHGPRRIMLAAVLSAVVGLQLGAFSVVLQTFMSGRSELPFRTFAMVMQPIHLAIGLLEGFVTAGIITFVRAARPGMLNAPQSGHPPAAVPSRKVLVVFMALALFTGGVLSWFASSHPDGLEWSVEKVLGKRGLPGHETGPAEALRPVQKATSFLPDYDFRKTGNGGENSEGGKRDDARPAVGAGRPVSGVLGSAIVLAAVLILGALIRSLRRKST